MTSLKRMLLSSFLPLATVAIVITAAVSVALFYRLEHASLQVRLNIGMQNVELEIDNLTKHLSDTTQTILAQKNVGSAVLVNNTQLLGDLAWQTSRVLRADNVIIYDRGAVTLAQTYHAEQPAPEKSRKGMVLKTLTGTIHKHLERSPAGLAITVFLPIFHGDQAVGVAEVIYLLDHKFVRQIKEKYGLDVLVYDGDRLQATTFAGTGVITDPRLTGLRALAASQRTLVTDEFTLGDDVYDVACNPLFGNDKDYAGALILAVSHQEIYQALWLMCSGLAVVAAIVIGIVAIFCLKISAGVVHPVESLVAATHAVSKGDLGQAVEISGVAEIRQLGLAFNAMTERLKATMTSVEHLNQEIAERKLAEENLKLANRELEEFAYTVAHDLRVPLAVIMGYAELLDAGCREHLDEASLGYLHEIIHSSEKMTMLMDDLLTLATVGRLHKAAAPYDSRDVVDEVLLALSGELVPAGINVKIGALPRVQLPNTLLTQIFSNLIGNAIRYGCKPGGSIEVAGERVGANLRFSVRDHGPGVPPEEREQIFEVFFRGRVGKKQEGTGIGLATVRKIARIHWGRVWVEETPGGGSTFIIEMVDPLTTAAEAGVVPVS